MDVEGAEWPVLNAMTAEDHSKILLFDLEIHWCRGFDKYSYVPPHMYTHATHTHVYTHKCTYIQTHAHSYPHVYVAHCRPLNFADVTTHFLLSLFFVFFFWKRYGPRIDSQLQRAHYAMKEIAKLKKYYVFVDRKMSRSLGIELLDPPKELTWDDAGCDMKKHYDMMSISLVNKNFLDILRQK